MYQLFMRLCLCSGFLLCSTVSQAADCKLPSSVTSDSLVRLAIQCSAMQKAIVARWQAQKHRVEFADSWADPTIKLGVAPNTFSGSEFDDGYIVEFSQLLPWPGVLSLRQEVAVAQADVLEARRSQDQIVLARDVRLRIAQWQYHLQLLAINQRHQTLWQTFLAVVQAKYAAGTADKSAVLQATHQHHSLLQEAIELTATVERDASQLKRLLNLPFDSNVSIDQLPVVFNYVLQGTEINKVVARLATQAGIKALVAQKRHKKLELELAEKDRYPSFSVSTRYNSLWAKDEQRWVVGVGFNIPLDFGKRSAREDSLRAEQNALRWQQQDLLIELREQMVQAHSFFVQSQSVHQLYQNDLLPLADENLITARNEYQSGEGDFLSLLTAQQQALTTERKAQIAIRDQQAHFANLTAAAGLVHISDWSAVLNINVFGRTKGKAGENDE